MTAVREQNRREKFRARVAADVRRRISRRFKEALRLVTSAATRSRQAITPRDARAEQFVELPMDHQGFNESPTRRRKPTVKKFRIHSARC